MNFLDVIDPNIPSNPGSSFPLWGIIGIAALVVIVIAVVLVLVLKKRK